MLDWIAERARERSTWLGITSLLTALGVGLSPELTEAIVTAGVAVGGIIVAVTSDEPKKTDSAE